MISKRLASSCLRDSGYPSCNQGFHSWLPISGQPITARDAVWIAKFPSGALPWHRSRIGMPGTKVTFETVRKIGLALPEVEDSTMYGKLALKVRGKLLACLAVHKSAEPESLVVRIDLEQRAGLLEEAPETYYVTDHYRNYPAVLVRLSRIPIDQLRDLLGASWRFVTSESKKNQRSSRAEVTGKLKKPVRKKRTRG
jgi:hypothetical protein